MTVSGLQKKQSKQKKKKKPSEQKSVKLKAKLIDKIDKTKS